jgi:N-acylglucosamine-6-phosphate 2-epimerase
MKMNDLLKSIHGGIIISCQAVPEDSTFGSEFMVAFACAAKRGGAVGIRANSSKDVLAIKKATGLPVIGIWKRPPLDGIRTIITPTVEDAADLKEAGADIIAVDVSDRPRPGGIDAVTLIQRINREVDIPIMADCSNLEMAIRAQDAGVAIAATTLSHPSSLDDYTPNLTLLEEMVKALTIPVIGEGRFWNPSDVQAAFRIGAHALVIGSAVTRPWLITKRYVKASPRNID